MLLYTRLTGSASSRSADTRLNEKRFSYLGRWFESCRELRLSGSWEPEAAGCTEHSRLPTLQRWHQLLLYLDTTNELLPNKGKDKSCKHTVTLYNLIVTD